MKYLLVLAVFFSCTSAELAQVAGAVLQNPAAQGPVTKNEIGLGLKEALSNGLISAVNSTNRKDGFLGNQLIRIPFPKEAKMVQDALKMVGGSSLINKVTVSLNRAAEQASIKAKPIFATAISQLTFTDVVTILRGSSNEATQYLQRVTGSKLVAAFSPDITKSLKAVHATKYWADVMSKYNQIPLVKKVNPNLTNYVTNEAVSGLFKEIAKTEKSIRKNPMERTSYLLKRVFGLLDN